MDSNTNQVITGTQLTYGHVEASSSPTGRSGFQFLGYKKDTFTERELLSIETRLLYKSTDGKRIKRVFFSTTTGKLAIGQIVPLQGTDDCGRAGRYFAHLVFFDSSNFERIDNNPFHVFRNFAFLSGPEEERCRRDNVTGEIGDITVSLKGQQQEVLLIGNRVAQLPRDEWRTILSLPLRFQDMRNDRSCLALYGDANDAYEWLESLFTLVPPQLRLVCTFDTHFVGGSLGRTPYWAVGLPRGEARSTNTIAFDLESRRFEKKPKLPLESASTVERWLDKEVTVDNESLEAIVERAKTAYWLGEWCEGRDSNGETLATVNVSILHSFIEANSQGLETRARSLLQKQVTDALGEAIHPLAVSWLRAPQNLALESMKNGFSVSELVAWVFEVYRDPERRPTPEELKGLKRLLNWPEASILRPHILRWACDWKNLVAALLEMPDTKFDEFASWAINTIPRPQEMGVQQDEMGGLVLGPLLRFQADRIEESSSLIFSLVDFREPGVDEANAVPKGFLRQMFGRTEVSRGNGIASRVRCNQARLAIVLKHLLSELPRKMFLEVESKTINRHSSETDLPNLPGRGEATVELTEKIT